MKTKLKPEMIDYYTLFEQLKNMLPMLEAQAVKAVEYGDMQSGRIHHRIEFIFTIAGPQYVIRRVDLQGNAGSGIYLGNCRIERVIKIAQDLIQDAHRPMNRWFKRAPQPKMRYFAY